MSLSGKEDNLKTNFFKDLLLLLLLLSLDSREKAQVLIY